MRKTIFLILAIALSVSAQSILVADYDNGLTFTNPDGSGEVDSEAALLTALDNNGSSYDLVSQLPSDLSAYDQVFLLVGAFSHSKILGYDDQQALVSFAQSGWLYLEGGDVGDDYHGTELWNLLGADYLHDGNPYHEGNVETLTGVPGTPGENLTFDCPGYQTNLSDSYLDELTNDGGTVIFTSAPVGNISNARVVYQQVDSRTTIVSSILFGSLADGGSTKAEYLESLLDTYSPPTSIEETTWGQIKAGI
ncbi:hypothetical protein K8R78_05130 [bacterium]|nr:hypothetical protein [bacterium]